MNKIDAPTIEGFAPVRSYSSLGISHVAMRSPDGVRLDVSGTGAAEADRSPHLLALLERMGGFIAEHNGYSDVEAVKEAEPGSIYAVANPERGRDGYKLVLASVYHPDSAPDTIVKAYDLDRKSAGLQFYLGGWLHDRLARADNGLRSPRQLAMFTAPSGHRTNVMEYIPGETLGSVASAMDRAEPGRQDSDRMVSAVKASVYCRVSGAAGWRGRLIANDIKNISNIVVEGDEALNPGNIPGQEFALIDQPVVTVFNYPFKQMARLLPVRESEAARQPVSPSPSIPA